MYGYGVEHNISKAMELIKKSADGAESQATELLGKLKDMGYSFT